MQNVIGLTTRFFRNKYVNIIVICSMALLFNLHPPLDVPSAGLDPSFDYGFNKAALMHLSFGNHFISTYGPLGYLTHDFLPNYLFQASIVQVLYAIALGVGIYLLIIRFYKLQSRILSYLIALIMVYAFSLGSSSSIDFNYLSVFLIYCTLFVTTQLSARRKRIFLIILALMAALFLYIKFTLGFASFGALLCLPMSNIRLHPKKKCMKSVLGAMKGIVLVGLSYFLSAYVFSLFLHVNNFIDYVKSSWIMSYNFSAAMSYQQAGTFIATIICAVGLAILILMFIIPLPKSKSLVNKAAFLAVPIFIAWKYAVVRQDAHIIFVAQMTIPLAVLVVIARLRKSWANATILMGMFAAVITCTVLATPLDKLVSSQTVDTILESPINNIRQHSVVSFLDFSNEQKSWSQEGKHLLANDILPKNFLNIIRKNGVDIYPWEASMILANNLTWQPRPSPFSFESYSPTFDNLNSEYFLSQKAPKYIIWQNVLGNVDGNTNSIDGRNVLWDEPATVNTILSHYKVIASASNELILLKRVSKPVTKPTKVISTQTVPWDQWITVPIPPKSDKYLFLSASYTTGMYIKLEDFLLRSETVTMMVDYNDGESSSYRLVTPNLTQGLLINPLPNSWDQLVSLLSKGQLGSKVTSIKFMANARYIAHVSSIDIKWLGN